MAMKQFNLEEYLANPSKKIITRDGRAVKIHCTNYDSRQPIIAELEYHNFSSSFTKDGRYYNDDRNSPYDLFFAPEKHEGWVNIYKAGAQRETLVCMVNRYVGSCIWPNKVAAKEAADPDPIATIKMEWEE